MVIDPTFMVLRYQDLLEAAARDRLAAQLPHQRSAVRRELAQACMRLADWLDAPAANRYVPPSESGPSGWAAGSASV